MTIDQDPIIAVVGRGIVGLSLAFALREAGRRVIVIGPRAMPGSATLAAVGSSTLKGHVTADAKLFALKIAGHKGLQPWLARIERASGLAVAKDFSGAYEPFYSLKDYRYIRDRVFHRQFTGCRDVVVRERGEISRRYGDTGRFGKAALGAFHYFRDGWFDPLDCLAALEEALRCHSVRFVEAAVERLLPHADSGVVIHCGAESLIAAECVVAAGVFSNEILLNSGISLGQQECVEGETLLAKTQGHPDVVLKLGKMNCVVHGGSLRVGSTSRRRKTRLECAPALDAQEDLAALARAEFPGSAAFSSVWGVRGRFKDHAPAIGSVQLPGADRRIWLALGFYKNGLQLGHLFAQNLIRLMGLPATISTAFPYPLDMLNMDI